MAEENKHAKIVAKAWGDPEFKACLLADPHSALGEMGMHVPEGLKVVVVENTANTEYVVLPTRPEGELSDEDLDNVAGGHGDFNSGGCNKNY